MSPFKMQKKTPCCWLIGIVSGKDNGWYWMILARGYVWNILKQYLKHFETSKEAYSVHQWWSNSRSGLIKMVASQSSSQSPKLGTQTMSPPKRPCNPHFGSGVKPKIAISIRNKTICYTAILEWSCSSCGLSSWEKCHMCAKACIYSQSPQKGTIFQRLRSI
jgi:hypothetical protein